MTVLLVLISIVPALVAAIVSLMTYLDNRRGHGNVDDRLGALESTVDRRFDSVESSVGALTSALQLVTIRQDLHEAGAGNTRRVP